MFNLFIKNFSDSCGFFGRFRLEFIYPRPDSGGELDPPPNTVALTQPHNSGYHLLDSPIFFTKKFLVLQN
ncbi:hypothetical protein EHR01_18660 [Leptospira mtsangambouensis]|uniref:Uncharacterized protein n=1 Tax=Leptospira mtsangambouensis TaxID=2484912 RepID=A0ABY2NYE3_9LEPT|nr:hypothetical protein EHR01_18660 [Leptospira mtsangambouensis]